MLSRKQAWRKQIKHIYRSSHDNLYKEGIYEFDGIGSGFSPTKTQSEPEMSQSQFFYLGKMWSTTGDLTKTVPKKKREVKFSNSVKVILIPKREEYSVAGIDALIWWTDADYNIFKSAAISELRDLMSLDTRIDSKTAQKILYQPPQPKINKNAENGSSNKNSSSVSPIPFEQIKQTGVSKYLEGKSSSAKSDMEKNHRAFYCGKIVDNRALHPLAFLCN